MTPSPSKRNVPSNMYFLEAPGWGTGTDKFIVCIGEADAPKIPVGYMRIERYDENQKAILSSRDTNGNKLFEDTASIYELKRRFLENEAILTTMLAEHQAKLDAPLPPAVTSALERRVPEQQPTKVSHTHER